LGASLKNGLASRSGVSQEISDLTGVVEDESPAARSNTGNADWISADVTHVA